MAAENFKVKKGLEVGTGSTITSDGVNVTGIVTATQFKGDGSGLTNVVGSGSGVVVKDEGSAVGTAGTINFVGSGVAATLSAGQATITIDGGGLNDIVSDTTPQLGGNLDLNSKDITGSGDIDITGNLNISGISTFGGTLKVDSTLRSNALSISTSFPAIYLYDNTTGANDYRITNSDGSLKISDTTNSSDILHRFEIASDGNVGINSTSPSTKLEVVGENGSTATFKSVASPHLLVTSDANLNEHQYQSTRNGVTIKSTEARLDLIAEGSGTHAGSFLMRDNSHDGFGFVNDFTNKELQLKSFTASGIAFRINSTGFNVSRLDDCIVIKKDGSVKLFNDGNLRLETTGTGINIPEDTSTSTLTVQAQAIISGLLDVIGNANISNDLDVDGHTNLDNVSIAETLNVVGVSTFSKEVGISSALNVAGVSTFNDHVNVTGRVTCSAITINDGQPGLFFMDTGANPDFVLQNRNGTFAIRDITSSPGVNRFFVNAANGDVTVTGNIAGDNSTNISGIASVTATSFHGSGAGLTSIPSAQLTGALPSLDGSALTGITASGSGVIVQHDGSNVGTAGTINFSTNLDVSPIHAGIVTVTASGGSGISTANVVTDTLNVAGVVTATGADINGNSIISGYLNVEATSGNSGALNVKGAENQDAYIQLVADEGDNNGDNWLIRHDHSSSNKLEFQNDISGTYVDKFTLSTGGDATISGSVVVGSAVTVNSGGVDAPTGTITGYNLVANNRLTVDSGIYGTAYVLLRGGDGGDTDYYSGGNSYSEHIFRLLQSGSSITRFRINRYGVVVSGVATATSFVGSGASITSLNADELDSGEIPSGRFPATLPAVSGANLTSLTAGNISGTLTSSQIADEAVTFAKMQHVGTGVLIGRNDSGSGDIETLTAAEARTLLNVADGATAGITTAASNVQVTWSVGANGSSAYRFTGPGNDGSDDNPDLYLVRGQRYRFINNSGGSHPFEIRSSAGGSAYSTGVTNNGASSGNIDFNVQHDAPTRLYYQCTSHGGMVGNIYITGGASWQTTDVNTSTTEEIFTNLNVGIGTNNPNTKLHVTTKSSSAVPITVQRVHDNNVIVEYKNTTSSMYAGLAGNALGWGVGTSVDLGSSSHNKFIVRRDTGNIGVGVLNPEQKLDVDGTIRFGTSNISSGTYTFTASAGSAVTADSTAVGNASAIEYTIFIINGSNIQSQKVLIMDNGSTAYSQEFAMMANPNMIATFSADVNSGNVRLRATPETGISGSTTIKFSKMIIE